MYGCSVFRRPNDMIAYIKRMRGATRISVGIASRKSDLDTFLSFVEGFKDKQVPQNWLATGQLSV